jgi:ribosomal protein S18 acetylase RimI-like enzyme
VRSTIRSTGASPIPADEEVAVVTVELRTMTSQEYDAWRPGAIEGYAAEHADAGSRPAETALEQAHKEFDELLPDGVETPEHHLLVATDRGTGVGLLWLNVPPPPQRAAFVFDVEVDEALRGKGYGRAIMLAAEAYVRERGCSTLRLHVFGSNTVARSLYESLGYETTNVMMSKRLGDPGGDS